MMEDPMYRENIIDHYQNPRNNGSIENPDIHLRELNPLCGDEVEIFIKLNSKSAKEISFKGKGCAISQAAASMLTEEAKGKTLDELKKTTNGDMIKMLAIPISPVRLKCALLALKTMEKAIYLYEGKNAGN